MESLLDESRAAARAARSSRTVLAREEFRELYRDTSKPLWGYLMRLCRNPADCDDLTQEAYCRLLTAEVPDMDRTQLRSYLYRIATNLVRDRYRTEERQRGLLARWFHGRETATSPRDFESRTDLDKVFGELKRRERELLWLAYVEGFQHREIAAILELHTESIRPLLFRARARLAELLKSRGIT